MFYAVLRPSEGVNLRVEDILITMASVYDDCQRLTAIFSIHHPKNKHHMGRTQFSLCHDSHTINWLRWILSGVRKHLEVFPGTYAMFRRLFPLLIDRLDLRSLRLTPASMRAGGIAHAYMSGFSVARLKNLGRWAGLKSLECYVQEAMCLRVVTRLSEQQQQDFDLVLLHAAKVFEKPPVAQWQRFFNRKVQVRMSALSRTRKSKL